MQLPEQTQDSRDQTAGHRQNTKARKRKSRKQRAGPRNHRHVGQEGVDWKSLEDEAFAETERHIANLFESTAKEILHKAEGRPDILRTFEIMFASILKSVDAQPGQLDQPDWMKIIKTCEANFNDRLFAEAYDQACEEQGDRFYTLTSADIELWDACVRSNVSQPIFLVFLDDSLQ